MSNFQDDPIITMFASPAAPIEPLRPAPLGFLESMMMKLTELENRVAGLEQTAATTTARLNV